MDANRFIASGYHHNEQEYNASGIMSAGDLMNIVCPLFKSAVAEKEVLEIGCGNGRVTQYLADVFKHIVGIDCSESMVEKAAERVNKTNVSFMNNDGSSIPLPASSIDIVYTFIVFQHCNAETIHSYFNEVHRVLRDGGYFIFQLPTAEKHSEPEAFNDVAKWTKDELESGLKQFTSVDIKNDHFGLHVCRK